MAEKTSTNKSNNAYSAKSKSRYQNFLQEAATLFPKVDQKLLLNILQFETAYSDWEGSVMFKIVYPAATDLDAKKEWIYKNINVFHL